MENLKYEGPQDGEGEYPGIHLTCADGGDPNAASEIVIHAQPGNAFFEFYFGPGFLGERQYMMALAPGQEDRLRAFCAKWLAPTPSTPGAADPAQEELGDTFVRLGSDLARAEKQFRECLPAQYDRAREIMRAAGDRWRDHIDRMIAANAADPEPERPSHACGPESGCDGICVEHAAWVDRQRPQGVPVVPERPMAWTRPMKLGAVVQFPYARSPRLAELVICKGGEIVMDGDTSAEVAEEIAYRINAFERPEPIEPPNKESK